MHDAAVPEPGQTGALAPDWLPLPDDPNDLAPGVWPASARRDDDGALIVAGVAAPELAREFGTPVQVLDEDEVRSRAREALRAFGDAAARHGGRARVYYAGKAFLSAEVARWMVESGLNVDVCSIGELEVALAAGVPAARIGFHGNNKRVFELERAIETGVGTIVVDSEIEIERLAAITERLDRRQAVLVRVNSGVHAETHHFLATAHEDQKFGFTLEAAHRAAERIHELPLVDLAGLHSHIGSQIFGVDGFREAASRVLELLALLREEGRFTAESADGAVEPVLNLGGGFGIAYTRADTPTPIGELAAGIVDAVADECAVRGIPLPVLAFEPGRSIVGTAGVTLYEVGTTKSVSVDTGSGPAERRYVSVDGGMSDNARPALYGAQYSARLASREGAGAPVLSRVVGLHCESGDVVVDHEYLPGDVTPGDLLAVPATGAYCAPLASNYNHIPRPPVVAVTGGRARVIVRGERIEDLLARDTGIRPAAAAAPTREGEE
ncbi:diaminopimelate decarboxylase [Microbacterium marinilacus]|uniref:Diaminopimelate decarboxylase n=1 Tax=Microbacterium marinilacus TaxID=415209 RepID=A0ABP7B6D5_9MICO|nr:diaminopimelate decarboxylase [Microbacterium marinilacus]MBY0690028.1 diaminopimelate decarboxylase [Microbacterium marinilacus]